METLTIVLIVALIFALGGAIYSAIKYNTKYNNAVATARYKSFVGNAGDKVNLTCPDGYVLDFSEQYGLTYYLPKPQQGSGCVCDPKDITSMISAGNQGKQNATITLPSGLPTGCSSNCNFFVYGQYQCVLPQ